MKSLVFDIVPDICQGTFGRHPKEILKLKK